MKKIIKMIILIITFFSINLVVNASSLRLEGHDNIYYTRYINGEYSSHMFSTYYMDDRLVYCLEPGVNIESFEYEKSTLDVLTLSDAVKERIELISFYGYEYPGHQDIEYLLATQTLIWEQTGASNVNFYTEQYGFGDYIDIEYYKDVINDLVNRTINRKEFVMNVHTVLGDTNNIVDFDVNRYIEALTDDNIVTINNNMISIKPTKVGESDVILKLKRYDSEGSYVYVNGDSQKLGLLRFSNKYELRFHLYTKSGSITINKFDKDNNQIMLNNAKYGLYTNDGNLINISNTNIDGVAIFDKLEVGNYYIKELESPSGYQIDDTKYDVEVTRDNLNINLNLENELIKKEVIIYKKDLDTNNIIEKEDIEFMITNVNNNQVYNVSTNKDGIININLPLGSYKLKELSKMDGYLVNESELYFDILEDIENVELDFYNKKEVIEGSIVNVPSTDTNYNIIIKIVSILVFILSIYLIRNVYKKI